MRLARGTGTRPVLGGIAKPRTFGGSMQIVQPLVAVIITIALALVAWWATDRFSPDELLTKIVKLIIFIVVLVVVILKLLPMMGLH